MTLQSIVYEWAERSGREPTHYNGGTFFAAAGWTIRIQQNGKPDTGYAFFVRIRNAQVSSHWCGTAADVEATLEEIASKFEAQELAEALT